MKVVCNCYYTHSSNIIPLLKVLDIGTDDMRLLSWAIHYMYVHKLGWEVCKYDKKGHSFSLIACPTFNALYEPIVGDSFKFTVIHEPPKHIPGYKTVYHQKHLMVDEVNYDGFDITESIKRTEILEYIPWYRENKSRIGSLRIWTEFLERYGLDKYMP